MKKLPRTVGEIMSETLIVLREDETLSDLTDGMERFSLRHLPVLRGERLVGLVNHKDILRAMVALTQRTPYHEPLRVRDIMSSDPLTVPPETPLGEAARLLLARKASCILVTDTQGSLLGIVTENDYLKLASELLDRV